jgi:hypothetical protein
LSGCSFRQDFFGNYNRLVLAFDVNAIRLIGLGLGSGEIPQGAVMPDTVKRQEDDHSGSQPEYGFSFHFYYFRC